MTNYSYVQIDVAQFAHRAGGALLIICIVLQCETIQYGNARVPTGEKHGVCGEDQSIHTIRIGGAFDYSKLSTAQILAF
jgi:hypothetical protein